jgi:hypothetical protein
MSSRCTGHARTGEGGGACLFWPKCGRAACPSPHQPPFPPAPWPTTHLAMRTDGVHILCCGLGLATCRPGEGRGAPRGINASAGARALDLNAHAPHAFYRGQARRELRHACTRGRHTRAGCGSACQLTGDHRAGLGGCALPRGARTIAHQRLQALEALHLCEVRSRGCGERKKNRKIKIKKYSVVRRAGHKGSVAERVEVGLSRVAVRRRMVLVWG